MKVIIANVFVAAVACAWWRLTGRQWFVTGLVFGAIIFASGLFMGVWCNQPTAPRRRKPVGAIAPTLHTDASAFEQLTP
jgi:hypothetical protein